MKGPGRVGGCGGPSGGGYSLARAGAPGTCRFTTGVSGPVPNHFYALMEMTVGQDRLFQKPLWAAWSRVPWPQGWLGGENPIPGQGSPDAAHLFGASRPGALLV